MSDLTITIIASILLVGLAITALSIGLIITGKVRLRRGCGWAPKDGKGDACKKNKGSCSICGTPEKDDDNAHPKD